MAFDADELAEHVAEVFADQRLGYVPDGFRFFRRSMHEPRHPEYWQASDKYMVDKAPQARWTWVVPRLPLEFTCACGRAFAHKKGLRAHQRGACKEREK